MSDIELVKQGARWLWAQGDYARLATILEPAASSLAARCVRPGIAVLDVAAGNGNFAIAAARVGARVTATDATPRMVELGAERTGAEGLDVDWREGDAEALPFEAATFDVVASVFGAVFAPRPSLVAAEMFRVVRPGGVVAMANYSPEGYLWRLSELIAGFSTRPGVSFPSPFLWGDEDEVRRRLEPHAATVAVSRYTLTLAFSSYDDWRVRFADVNPPLMAMKALLPPPAFDGLLRDAWALFEQSATDAPYLEVVATSLRG